VGKINFGHAVGRVIGNSLPSNYSQPRRATQASGLGIVAETKKPALKQDGSWGKNAY
jgi:hypothetical protein